MTSSTRILELEIEAARVESAKLRFHVAHRDAYPSTEAKLQAAVDALRRAARRDAHPNAEAEALLKLQNALAAVRHHPMKEMPTQTRILELELAIIRTESAQMELRLAKNPSDEQLAKHHLALATGHVKKLMKLHPNIPTPKKKAKKKTKDGFVLPTHENQQVVMNSAGRVGAARRVQYRGRDERRFVSDLRPGQETRHHDAHRCLEVRDLTGGMGKLVSIEGEPIVYNQPYSVRDLFGEFEETMKPGVAARILTNADCRFLVNHTGLPLARSTTGTLKLADSSTTLRFSATVDTRQRCANDLVIAIERGDVSGMSVGFVVAADSWNADHTKRSITRLRELLDVSAVTYPASPTTSISLASMGGRVA